MCEVDAASLSMMRLPPTIWAFVLVSCCLLDGTSGFRISQGPQKPRHPRPAPVTQPQATSSPIDAVPEAHAVMHRSTLGHTARALQAGSKAHLGRGSVLLHVQSPERQAESDCSSDKGPARTEVKFDLCSAWCRVSSVCRIVPILH